MNTLTTQLAKMFIMAVMSLHHFSYRIRFHRPSCPTAGVVGPLGGCNVTSGSTAFHIELREGKGKSKCQHSCMAAKTFGTSETISRPTQVPDRQCNDLA